MTLDILSKDNFRFNLPKWGCADVRCSLDKKPQIALSHFDGEVKASFIPNVAGLFTPLVKDGVITFSDDKFGFGIKQTPIRTPFNEYGGFDLEILLKVKPQSNILSFGYDATNLVPFHQGELTPLEKSWNAIRPPHVRNSIAWYHSSKGGMVTPSDRGKVITTGKAFHQYALLMVDAQGKIAWAGWFLNGSSEVQLVLDEELYKNGTYPILVKPVGDAFGYTGIGGTPATQGVSGANVGQYIYTASTGDTVTGFYAYTARGAQSSSATSLAVYDEAGGVPVNRLAAEVDVESNTTPAWYNTTGQSQSLVNATDYVVAHKSDASTNLYYDSTPGVFDFAQGITNTLPDPWDGTAPPIAFRMSFYAEYTAGAVGLSIPIAMHHYKMLGS